MTERMRRHGDDLRFKVRLAQRPLSDACRRFWSHPELEALFPEYVFHLHCAMRASVPLMQATLERAASMVGVDPVATYLVEYLAHHIEEEQDHAAWLLEDMAHLQLAPRHVLARVPPTCVAELIGTQYYWTQHVAPVTLMAYFAVLEGSPMTEQSIESYVARTNIPRGALRTLLEHARSDQMHRDELFEALDRMPLNDDQVRQIGVNAFQVIEQLTRVFEHIMDPGQVLKAS